MTFDDFRFRVKYEKDRIKRRFKEKFSKVWNWIRDNKEILAFLLPFLIPLIKKSARAVRNAREDAYYDTHVYDPVSHTWINTGRKPKGFDESFARRRNDGESVVDILKSYGLL